MKQAEEDEERKRDRGVERTRVRGTKEKMGRLEYGKRAIIDSLLFCQSR